MPDNLPDLSNASFALRMETPGLKRPSRPSQDTSLDWEREQERPIKRPSRPSQDTSLDWEREQERPIKRASRPSQDSTREWDRERDQQIKKLRGESRNNSILSSLSSSRRFAEKLLEVSNVRKYSCAYKNAVNYH